MMFRVMPTEKRTKALDAAANSYRSTGTTVYAPRFWRDQGKPQQAREMLAPVYNWFTEGFI
jgi:hypothetical protein